MLYIALAAAAGLIGLDQLTKILIDSNMQLHQSIPIISFGDTNVLNITYERNPGAASLTHQPGRTLHEADFQ